MAELRETFKAGLETIFDTFEEAVHLGTYTEVTDNGFDAVLEKSVSVRCIFEKFINKDIELLSFSELIQPTDIKGLIPADDVTLLMSVKGYCTFDDVNYSVEGYDLDPMSVLYTLLLRKT